MDVVGPNLTATEVTQRRCPYGVCRMRNLCRLHCVRAALERDGYVLNPDGDLMSTFTKYRRKGFSELRPYVDGEDLSHVSIADVDRQNGSPKEGDMIARNPKNHGDQWLVAKKYFDDNLEPAE